MKAKISQSVNLVSLNYAVSGKCVEFHAPLKFMIVAHSTFTALIKDDGMQTPFLKFFSSSFQEHSDLIYRSRFPVKQLTMRILRRCIRRALPLHKNANQIPLNLIFY